MVNLTKRTVESAVATGRDMFLWDDDVQGFGVRIFRSGKRSYLVQFRVGGKLRRSTIGSHGTWTVETARKQAKVLLGKAAGGIDPIDEKERAMLTVAALCDRYLTEGLFTAKDSSISQAKSNIENHIKPLIGSRLAVHVCRADVQQLMRDIAEGKSAKVTKRGLRSKSRVRGGKGAANRTIGILSAAFSFGVDAKLRVDNPVLGVKKYPEKKLERFLSPAELATLGGVLAAAESLGVENQYAIAAIRLLVLTGCRKNEILRLKRAWVDNYHRCLRLPDSKTGAKVVHLGAPAIRLIASLKPVAGNPYLLPGNAEGTHLADLKTVWGRIRKAAGLDDVRIHDLRHSFASMGASNGDSLLVLGALLGHKSAKTTQRYAHLADHPVKSAADRIATTIAEYLDSLEDSAAGEPVFDLEASQPVQMDGSDAMNPILGVAIRTKWLDTRAAAVFLGKTVGTLQTYRWMGTGPEFTKIGRRVVYSRDILIAWRNADGAQLSLVDERLAA
jgi:integrase